MCVCGGGGRGTLRTNRILIFTHFLFKFRQVACFVQLIRTSVCLWYLYYRDMVTGHGFVSML